MWSQDHIYPCCKTEQHTFTAWHSKTKFMTLILFFFDKNQKCQYILLYHWVDSDKNQGTEECRKKRDTSKLQKWEKKSKLWFNYIRRNCHLNIPSRYVCGFIKILFSTIVFVFDVFSHKKHKKLVRILTYFLFLFQKFNFFDSNRTQSVKNTASIQFNNDLEVIHS